MRSILFVVMLPLMFSALAVEPVFHFDFAEADGKNSVNDRRGNFTAKTKRGVFTVTDGKLRVAPGAQIFIPDTRQEKATEQMTVMAWILKKSTPDAAPILFKGEYPYSTEFVFGIGWRYPRFCYKNETKQSNWKGIWYIGDFGSGTHYPIDSDFEKSGAKLIESSGYWHHLAAVFDRGNVQIFLDGILTAEAKVRTPEKLLANELPFWIGGERLENCRENKSTADMLLNDLRLYCNALTEHEIGEIIKIETAKYPKGNLIPPGRTHLNALLPCYSYLSEEFDPLMKKILPSVVMFEAGRQAVKPREKNLLALVKRVIVDPADPIGVPGIFIDGKEVIPLAFKPNTFDNSHNLMLPQRNMAIREFAAAGINLVSVSVSTGQYCIGENEYDWSYVDMICRESIKNNPNVRLSIYCSCILPKWFGVKYPDEVEQGYYSSKPEKLAPGPLGSDVWLKVQKEFLQSLVKHIENQDYGKYVYEYLPGGGQSSEWYWPSSVTGGIPGYSQGTLVTFRKWLKNRYKTDAALQTAWHDETITLDTAQVPSVESRRFVGPALFRDPVREAAIIDFRRYMTDRTVLFIQESARAIKNACHNQKLVTIYSGYDLPVQAKKLFHSGLSNSWGVAQIPEVDMLCTPITYVGRHITGEGLRVNAFEGSAKLAGKLLWAEDDPRTHLCLYIDSDKTETLQETIEVMKRTFGQALTRSSGAWWLLFDNSWFHQNEINTELKKCTNIYARALKSDRRSTAEAAVIFDEESQFLLSLRQELLGGHTWSLYTQSVRSGAPFDFYYLPDLANKNMPDYKLYIFITSYQVSEQTRTMIHDQLAKNHATAVWCYAPGYFNEKQQPDLRNMKELTGFDFRIENALQAWSATVPENCAYPELRGISSSATFAPAFFAQNGEKIMLTSQGDATLAQLDTGRFNSIFTLFPADQTLLRFFCRRSGVHIYSTHGDVLTVSRSFLSIHTDSTAGPRNIMLPGKYRVTELFSKRIIGDNISQFSDHLPAGTTVLYSLESVR